ncbi:hypothetical protein MHYP_G00104480 [Metynnis hypsauchen]
MEGRLAASSTLRQPEEKPKAAESYSAPPFDHRLFIGRPPSSQASLPGRQETDVGYQLRRLACLKPHQDIWDRPWKPQSEPTGSQARFPSLGTQVWFLDLKRNRNQPKQRDDGDTQRGRRTAEKRVEFYFRGEQKETHGILKKVGFNDLSEAEVQFRMKILLVFTLCLISGPVSCFDVIGYSGGSVMIHCKNKQYGVINKYFCKEKPNQTPKQCVNERIQDKWSHKDRLSLRDSSEVFTVIYRQLSLQDAGSYRCGETGVWSHDMNLEVKTDPCCLGSNTVSGYLGETVTINCSYPEEVKSNYQFLFKQDGQGFTEVNRTSETRSSRFSISDDKSSAVLSVRISDVREDDGGVYYCGSWIGEQSVSYYSLYSETRLQITGGPSSATTPTSAPAGATSDKHITKETSPSPKQPPTGGPSSATRPTKAPTGATSDKHTTPAPDSSVIIIPVCVCVALLLIGGSAIICYKLRCTKTQGSISSSNVAKTGSNNRISGHLSTNDVTSEIPPSACDYEEIRDPRPNGDTGATPLSVELPSDPPNAVTVTEQQPSNSSVQHIYSEVDLPTEDYTYATVSIQNEDSRTDATVAFHTGKSDTMYATVKHQQLE